VLVFYLVHKIKADTARFNAKIKVLEDFIINISKEQTNQNNQLQLSDALKQQLQLINATLNKEVFELNYQLFEELQSRK
jgi:hypothetical protein